MLDKINPTETSAWEELSAHYEQMKDIYIKNLFASDSQRAEKFSIQWKDILFDYSKNIINEKTIGLLTKLAEETKVTQSSGLMFNGDTINETEHRAVLHTALRNLDCEQTLVNGKNVITDIKRVLKKIELFSEQIYKQTWRGATGKPITDIVNIGIGGSDLGPVMACKALKHYSNRNIKTHFVSNVDGTHICETLLELNPENTLFIIVSKTFTTQETMANAITAKQWLTGKLKKDDAISRHFVAVSTNAEDVSKFGIDIKNMFEFWDFVGGRFSLWSAVGLSVACSVGFDNFKKMLEGAYEMDVHFRTAPIEKNIPTIMALLSIWYTDFFKAMTEAVLPYEQYLERFPAYLQQAAMESNGKSVDRNGKNITYYTNPVLWGEPGTNGQHSFYQMIHQGTQMIPCTFLAGANTLNPVGEHQTMLLSNFFAQPEALMNGKTFEEAAKEMENKIGKEEAEKLAPYRTFNGNIPTISILYKKLTPEILGSLIAMYEHKIFVQSIIWNIYGFDQWGVELGKQLANKILPELKHNEKIYNHDSSTNNLINKYKEWVENS